MSSVYAVKDQTGFEVVAPQNPKRVISLVPSQTELIYELGVNDALCGITKFCIYPQSIRSDKKIVGGTKNVNIKIINQLNPDLIIGNMEENQKDQIEILRQKYPVWLSDVRVLDDALGMILMMGRLLNRNNEAKDMIRKIKLSFDHLPNFLPKKAVYFIWENPKMVVGKNTFIDNMMTYCGFQNCITAERYPVLSQKEIERINPEFVLLSSEPFPFKDKHIYSFQKLFPNAKVLLVNGELFSWYGSRLLQSAKYFEYLRN